MSTVTFPRRSVWIIICLIFSSVVLSVAIPVPSGAGRVPGPTTCNFQPSPPHDSLVHAPHDYDLFKDVKSDLSTPTLHDFVESLKQQMKEQFDRLEAAKKTDPQSVTSATKCLESFGTLKLKSEFEILERFYKHAKQAQFVGPPLTNFDKQAKSVLESCKQAFQDLGEDQVTGNIRGWASSTGSKEFVGMIEINISRGRCNEKTKWKNGTFCVILCLPLPSIRALTRSNHVQSS
ncbi:hypothetical protein H0H93_014929 [Arthromyces matolae]|nr:hypothetical protein H0H93_014929 [Arthromyces matolae]